MLKNVLWFTRTTHNTIHHTNLAPFIRTTITVFTSLHTGSALEGLPIGGPSRMGLPRWEPSQRLSKDCSPTAPFVWLGRAIYARPHQGALRPFRVGGTAHTIYAVTRFILRQYISRILL